MSDLINLTAKEINSGIISKKFKATEVMQAFLDQISAKKRKSRQLNFHSQDHEQKRFNKNFKEFKEQLDFSATSRLRDFNDQEPNTFRVLPTVNKNLKMKVLPLHKIQKTPKTPIESDDLK